MFKVEQGSDATKDEEKIRQIDKVPGSNIVKQKDTVTPVSQAGPIVLINIHANGLNLDSADQIAEAIQKTLGYKEETIETEKLKVEESEEEKVIPDYVDYADYTDRPADYIRISMESQFMDQR